MLLLGKLGWDSIPKEPIVLVTMVLMAIGAKNGDISGKNGLHL